MPLESEKSHCFKWFFTKMADSVVSGWESGLEPAGICFWLWVRTSSSSLGNNPSMQNHWCKNQGKCNQTCYPTNEFLFFVLMRPYVSHSEPDALQKMAINWMTATCSTPGKKLCLRFNMHWVKSETSCTFTMHTGSTGSCSTWAETLENVMSQCQATEGHVASWRMKWWGN